MTPNSHPATATLRLAITLGDPAGVGPEILVQLFTLAKWPPNTAPFVVGEVRHIRQAADALGFPIYPLAVTNPPDHPPAPGEIPVIEPRDFLFPGDLHFGRVAAPCGAAAWAYVREAVALIQEGRADAIVTAPLHKESLHAAGCHHPGHTELIAELAGDRHVAMLLVGGGIRVALATIHVPLHRVPRLLNTDGIVQHLHIMHAFIPWFGLRQNDADATTPPRPRIGVTGLNPHAGEGGMFGDEEKHIIAPAIARAHAEGINAVGPLPADTAFHFHREGAYDAILAMYHDQALIPVKTLDFHRGVNVTMGLPFIRTSVDHGTAFDIAGKGIARPDSLRSALETAAVLTRNRRKMETAT